MDRRQGCQNVRTTSPPVPDLSLNLRALALQGLLPSCSCISTLTEFVFLDIHHAFQSDTGSWLARGLIPSANSGDSAGWRREVLRGQASWGQGRSPAAQVLNRDGPWWKVAPEGTSELEEPELRAGRVHFSVTTEMELDMKTGGAGPATAAQRLQQAGMPAESERAAAASMRSSQGRSTLRWFSTAILYAAYMGLGMSVALLGPTLQDLAANVNRNISSLSVLFVGRSSGFLCGTMTAGVLYDHMNQFLLLGMSMVATTVGLYLIPFCKTAVVLIITMCAFGASAGAVTTGGNVLILALWGDKGAPHMQALYFSFALGAFLAPLLAKLAWGTTASAQNHTEFDPLMLNRSSGATSDSLFAVPEDITLLWAYASIGTYVLVVSVFLFGLFCKKHSRQKKSTASAQEARRAKYHRALLCLLFLFLFYVGTEITFGSYVFSFATTHVGMEEAEAAGVNSAFWGSFAACRGLAIFFATLLKPGTMIVLSIVGSFVSSFFLVLFDKSPLCLWIATSVYGASLATVFPSSVSWIKQYTSINARSTAFFGIGIALGDIVSPAIIGILQGHYPDLPAVPYTCLGSSIFTAVLFPVLCKLATLPLDRQRKETRVGKDHRTLSISSRL